MKVGILSFHDIYNPGAFFQAYATMKLVESLGHSPLVIDYISPRHRFRPWRQVIRRPYLLCLDWNNSFYKRFGRHRAFREAQQKYMKLTKPIKTHTALEKIEFDVVLVGADIVWFYQSKLWGDDPVYFGHHLNARKIVASVPSCGPLDLNKPTPDFVKEGLLKFDAISVRDGKTADLVKNILNKDVPVIMDPTFDLDINELPSSRYQFDKKYLFVYAIPAFLSTETISDIRTYAKRNNLTIVTACYDHGWADVNITYADPFDWFSLLRHATAVFTNSFHGTIFSAKANVPFVTEYNSAVESKLAPVLDALDLHQCRLTNGRSIESILQTSYDSKKVKKNIQDEANVLRQFLKNTLKDSLC